MKKKKVIIIGAGPAGLTAAYELMKDNNKYEVIILEESNQIGGISKTVNYKGNRMDIGGHRFFSKNDRVINFWNEIMPIQGAPAYDDKKLNRKKDFMLEGPDPEKEDLVMLIRNRISRIYYLNTFFDYPINLKLDTIRSLGFKKTVSCGFSYLKTLLVKKKETSLENFYINRFGNKLYSMFFKNYTEKLWGRSPKDISSDWGSQRVKGISIYAIVKDIFLKTMHINNKHKETSLIEEFYYPKYGPGQLWEEVANKIISLKGKISFNHKVTKVIYKNKKIEAVECDVNGKKKQIKGDIFISSMPIKDLVNSIDTNVPKNILKIANGLPYRAFITIGLLVDKLNINNETNIKTLGNIIPDCWIYVQEDKVKLGRIQIFNNWSPYMVKNPEKQVWMGLEYFCDENDNFWNMSDEDLFSFVKRELLEMNLVEEDKIKDYHVEKIKKAYPAYFDTYKDIDKIIRYLNKIDNLYCIGRNGQHRYNNMDHSMLTAFKCIDCIEKNLKNKDNIWNVNTEKEYHEVKK